jgi:hypothetical protein
LSIHFEYSKFLFCIVKLFMRESGILWLGWGLAVDSGLGFGLGIRARFIGVTTDATVRGGGSIGCEADELRRFVALAVKPMHCGGHSRPRFERRATGSGMFKFKVNSWTRPTKNPAALNLRDFERIEMLGWISRRFALPEI